MLRHIFKEYNLIVKTNKLALFSDKCNNPWILYLSEKEYEDIHHPLFQECLRSSLTRILIVPKLLKIYWNLFHYWKNKDISDSSIQIVATKPLMCWAETLWGNHLPYQVASECGDLCGGGDWLFHHLPKKLKIKQVDNHIYYVKKF